MRKATFEVNGMTFMVIERAEYDRLRELAKAAALPALPEPDADGNVPAVQFARATLARKIIQDRVAAGLSQKELARLAGIRGETLCRIETGKHSPSVESIQSIDRALRRAVSRSGKTGKSQRVPQRAKAG
jgi:DNA-binding XRE family transcriptional regulator